MYHLLYIYIYHLLYIYLLYAYQALFGILIHRTISYQKAVRKRKALLTNR